MISNSRIRYALLVNLKVITSRRKRYAGRVARMEEMKRTRRILVEKSEGKRARGGFRRRWEDNIKKIY
jgi:hypothetical protein